MKVPMKKQGGMDPQTERDVYFGMQDLAGKQQQKEQVEAEAEGREPNPQAGHMAYALQASYDNLENIQDMKARRLLNKGQFGGP